MEKNRAIPTPDPNIGAKTIDLNFKPNPVHLTIIKDAKKNNGLYDRIKAIKKIKESDNPQKLKNQMLMWNQQNINTLIKAGCLEPTKDNNLYKLTSIVDQLDTRKKFTPGKNHLKLLEKNVDGIIVAKEVKKEFNTKTAAEAKRQKSFTDGMIKSLFENEYLEKVDKGIYKLTDKALAVMEHKETAGTAPANRGKSSEEIKQNFKITYFDRHIEDVLTDGKIDPLKVAAHEKADSITARIETLKKEGYIENDKPSESFMLSIDRVKKFIKSKELTPEMLTKEQLALMKDLRIFLNLSFTQISTYIYNNDKAKARIDLEFLIKKKILKREDFYGIYVFDTAGIAFSNKLLNDPDAVKYHTKLHSRPEEVEHDMLVYSAFQEWSKDLIGRGGEILELKNDRQMRRADAKKYGNMINGYPDLRVLYKEPGDSRIRVYDIEMDCGYNKKTILSKIHNLRKSKSLGWYCKTAYQAAKVANILTKDTDKASRMNTRKIDVYYLDPKTGGLIRVSH